MERELALINHIIGHKDVCLHGSKTRFLTAEPRQARCDSGAPEGNLKGVYATPDDAAIAIFKALADRVRGAHSAHTGYSRHGDGPLVLTGTNATLTPGYVHVLPVDHFAWIGTEFVSTKPVPVLSTIRVDPSILRLLGDDIDLRIPIPSPY